MMMKTFSATVVLAVGATCAFAADIFREDFEGGADRWKLPTSQWNVVDGAGLDGSRALVLEYTKDEIPKWLERNEMVPVEPGEAYRFEAWVNEKEFKAKDRPVSVSFAVYDSKSRLLRGSGAGSVRIADNIIRKDGFCRVEGTTRPLPMNASKGRFYIWAKEGSHGRVAFDGFRIYPVAVNALESLCCSAYRNEAAEGTVGFSAGYAVNELKHDVKRIRAELRYLSREGEKVALGTLSNGVASVLLPVEAFAFGTNKVSMTLKIGEKTLGQIDCEFARLNRLPQRRVWFDKYGRTILDGRPFLPLGMYWNDVNAADLAVYTNTVFNCLMPYKRPDAKKMDMCAAAGIKVIYPICGFYELMASTNVQKAARYRANYIDGLVEKFRSHPATLAWYLADELPSVYAKHLEDRRQMCHRLDPDHPTWICINNPSVVRMLVNGYDALGMDPYPVGSPWGSGSLDLASDWALKARNGMYGYRPMWQIPQAFDWSHYVKNTYAGQGKDWKKPKNMRMPTREEMSSMTWQAIAAGANGIVYYYFEDAYRRGATDEEKARRWADVCAVAREVKEKESVILADPGPVPMSDPKSVVCRSWRMKDGSIRLLVCSIVQKSAKVEVSVGGKTVAVQLAPFGVEWVNL